MQSLLRIVLFGLIGIGLFFFLGRPGGSDGGGQPLRREPQLVPQERAAASRCDIATEHFRAGFSSSGATLKDFKVLTPKYQRSGGALDLSTTPHPGFGADDPNRDDPNVKQPWHDREFRQQLFSQWRNATVAPLAELPFNVEFDSFDYQVSDASGKACTFRYQGSLAQIEKRIEATERPYELLVTNKITNVSDTPRAHAFAMDTVAWWLDEAVEAKMFRVSPYVTHVECQPFAGSTVRLLPDAFEAGDFADAPFQRTFGWGFQQMDGEAAYVGVANAYFAQALAPVAAFQQVKPLCQLQIEQRGAKGTAGSGAYYRARLAYPAVALGPGEEASYSVLTYVGPKEREILARAGGGEHRLDDLIDLGFFAQIAKVLVKFLLFVYSIIPNWGVAIIVLTVTARVLLFPLSVPGIKNMIKMRELKPEVDAINAKYKDDPQAKGLEQMKLWKERGVNPMKGCLPQLASMPVWFALYTTLQTAVELYNIRFLWFPDLSEPDPYFVLPFVIGGTFFVQQKMMPIQGGDPMQQKMMMYFMPAMFTVFMLFLPAGLGVYMFTNSVLAIIQQQAVEASVRKTMGRRAEKVEVQIITTSGTERPSGSPTRPGTKKGGVQGAGRLLDKGKART